MYFLHPRLPGVRLTARRLIVGLFAVAVCFAAWASTVLGQEPPSAALGQQQVDTALSALRDSEAETAAGSYVPGSGAFFTIELIHGPNSEHRDIPYRAVRDWAIYLMTTFGASLTAVPAEETIAFTVRYYDYLDRSFHSLTIAANASDVTDPEAFRIWLDGAPYSEDAARQTESENGGDVPAPTPTSSTILVFETTPTAEPTPVTSPVASPIASPPVPEGAIGFDTSGSVDEWTPVGGTWQWRDGAYEQIELNRFDLISYYRMPLQAPVLISVEIKFIEGQMGAGLVFGAPELDSKRNARMVSFAADGSFLQWGYYDDAGVFQYQGGVTVETAVADGAWHTLSVTIANGTYAVSLDGAEMGTGVPLIGSGDGYAGLLSSTVHAAFDNVRFEALP
jgi:hypothetical protein